MDARTKLKMKSTPADKNLLLCKLVNTFLMRHTQQVAGGWTASYEEKFWPFRPTNLADKHTHSVLSAP